MADLISRAAAIDAIKPLLYCGDFVSTLIHLSAVDAVPVVRCRDCKYAHMTYGGEVKYCDKISMPDDEGDYGYALYLPGDWFCADGERRESDE